MAVLLHADVSPTVAPAWSHSADHHGVRAEQMLYVGFGETGLLHPPTAVSSGVVKASGRLDEPAYVTFSLPLLIVMGMVFSALGTAIAAYHDLHSGMDDRLSAVVEAMRARNGPAAAPTLE